MRRRSIAIALACVLCAGCEKERTIPTRAHPEGEVVRCVGIAGNGKRPGIEYELSDVNVVVAILGFEIVAPPVIVLAHETFCPASDTTRAVPSRRP